jgi:hypothetical protein
MFFLRDTLYAARRAYSVFRTSLVHITFNWLSIMSHFNPSGKQIRLTSLSSCAG